MSTHEYKGQTIHVWIKKISAKRYDWSVKAGDLPTRNNSGEWAPSESVAESEAVESARRELDRMKASGHG